MPKRESKRLKAEKYLHNWLERREREHLLIFHFNYFQGGPLDTMRNLDQFLPQDNSGKGEE